MRSTFIIILYFPTLFSHSQVVLNGYFDILDSNTYYIYDSSISGNTKPYITVHPEQVSLRNLAILINGDSIINCPSPPACIMFEPVNFTHSFFTYSHIVMKLSAPLDSGTKYTISISMRIYYPTNAIVPCDPWMGLKVSQDSIMDLDECDDGMAPSLLANATGSTWHFPWNKNADLEWHEITGTIKAIGGEKYLYFGIVQDRPSLKIEEILQVDRHVKRWVKTGKEKHMRFLRKVFNMWSVDQVSDSELVDIIHSNKEDSTVENPSYIIDNVTIDKFE